MKYHYILIHFLRKEANALMALFMISTSNGDLGDSSQVGSLAGAASVKQ